MKKAYKFSNNELHLVIKLMRLFFECGFKDIRLPEIYWSDQLPPLKPEKKITNDKELENEIDYLFGGGILYTDLLLGVYEIIDGDQSEGRIILYSKSIKYYARKAFPSIPEQDAIDNLKIIVLLHEIGHWIAHWLPDESNTKWGKGYWDDIEKTANFHEAWAQLMVFWVINGIDDISVCFEELATKQTVVYRKYRELSKYAAHYVIKHFRELRTKCGEVSFVYNIFKCLIEHDKTVEAIFDDIERNCLIKLESANWAEFNKLNIDQHIKGGLLDKFRGRINGAKFNV